MLVWSRLLNQFPNFEFSVPTKPDHPWLGRGGRALAEAARLRRPGLKVLYMTGYSRNAIVHQGRLDAGVSLMQKPFSQNVLAMRVRSMLEEA